jgi:hypothetical protein
MKTFFILNPIKFIGARSFLSLPFSSFSSATACSYSIKNNIHKDFNNNTIINYNKVNMNSVASVLMLIICADSDKFDSSNLKISFSFFPALAAALNPYNYNYQE